ncbi:MAG: aminotransferase class I/II-fold pyridoxal phosphate-dependent enzyme, partial [Verrucomicrobiota bacterium]|nr:aminotransferase class I/II-fold pyridoxal phosphate-dependent enzyme [Verrucomicrobiota bacterium]
FTAAPLPIAKAISAIQSHSTSNPTSFAQSGAIQALDGPQEHITKWMSEFSKRRTFAHEQLNAMPGITCVNAQGAFYLFPNISSTGMKSAEFCERLLSEAKVAAIPGVAFGSDEYIRISYATGMENLEEALKRLTLFLKKSHLIA